MFYCSFVRFFLGCGVGGFPGMGCFGSGGLGSGFSFFGSFYAFFSMWGCLMVFCQIVCFALGIKGVFSLVL